MKQHLVLLLFSVSILPVLDASGLSTFSPYALCLGGAGIANDEGMENPANLASENMEDITFSDYASYQDTYGSSSGSGSNSSIFQSPVSYLGASFFGTGVSMTLQIKNYLDDKKDSTEDAVSFTGHTLTMMQMDIALPLKFLQVGLRLRGGSEVKRQNAIIRSGLLAIPDYFIQTYLERYEYVEGSESYSVGLGARKQINDAWALAFTADLYQGGEDASTHYFLDTLRLGFSYATPTYNKENALNFFKVRIFGDISGFTDSDSRYVSLATEVRCQLLRDHSVSFFAAVKALKPELMDYITFDAEKMLATTALALSLPSSAYSVAVSFPLSDFSDFSAVTVSLTGQYRL
ncbi:MAG: hypothetical protein LKE40_00250 [Spirochaetia bacterium]|jgi:hypothetical protein|nr:hypothetical protein [Spirochaetia bacterium]